MNRLSQKLMYRWLSLGPRFLPFADAATPELPLSRLLRLSLFQVSVGMALTLLVGTLNRVMIVELGVPASLVSIMVSLPLVFAPFRALIGFRSDIHRSALGWKRVPFIWRGTLLQFGGLSIMPFALLVLGGQGQWEHAPVWLGHAGAAIAFLLVGIGVHMTQTVGLALATDLAAPEQRPKVVGLMYVMMLFGMMVSALIFGAVLVDFSRGRLIQVIQASAVITVILNVLAMWKQEARDRAGMLARAGEPDPDFWQSWDRYASEPHALRRLLAIGFGTMAFSMSDILLEPFGGQILSLTVGTTTLLTATVAVGGLFGFGWASRVLSRGADPIRMASYGAMIGIPAFLIVISSAPLAAPLLLAIGTFMIGFGAGLFGHGTLTATMNAATQAQTGLALGAWGAVQASAAGLAVALGGVVRDLFVAIAPATVFGAAGGYVFVFGLEILLLVAALLTLFPLARRRPAFPGEEKRALS